MSLVEVADMLSKAQQGICADTCPRNGEQARLSIDSRKRWRTHCKAPVADVPIQYQQCELGAQLG